MNALECHSVIKKYKKTKGKLPFSLNIEQFYIEEGDINSLIGLNGSGKTTLLKIITNLQFYDKGCINIFGLDHKSKKNRHIISYLPENFSFPSNFTVKEVLMYYLAIKSSNYRVKKYMDEAIGKFNLEDYLHKKIHELSKGMYQNLALAITLTIKSDFYILDEPFNGLDNLQKKNVINLLINKNKKHNVTLFVITHIFSDIEKFVKNVSVMHQGSIISNKSLNNILEDYNSISDYFFSLLDKSSND